MKLTNEILEYNGFKTNHPEKVLKSYSYMNDDWRIKVTEVFKSIYNKTVYDVTCWKISNSFDKKLQMSGVETLEEINVILSLCQISFLLLPLK